MNYDDLLVMYGKRAQKLDLYRAKLTTEDLNILIEELNKDKNIIDLVLDQANFRKCQTEIVTKFLKETKYVKTLSLRCAKLDKGSLDGLNAGLKGNQRIIYLDLYSTGLSADSLISLFNVLATSFSLQTLNLSNLKMKKNSLDALCNHFIKKSTALNTLFLETINAGPEDMIGLCECLGMSISLKRLVLLIIYFRKNMQLQ